MSFGPPINRPDPPPKGAEARDTWVPCPWNPKLEQNLESPPKLRTKGYMPPAEPKLVHPPQQPAAVDTEAEDGYDWAGMS